MNCSKQCSRFASNSLYIKKGPLTRGRQRGYGVSVWHAALLAAQAVDGFAERDVDVARLLGAVRVVHLEALATAQQVRQLKVNWPQVRSQQE